MDKDQDVPKLEHGKERSVTLTTDALHDICAAVANMAHMLEQYAQHKDFEAHEVRHVQAAVRRAFSLIDGIKREHKV